MCGRTCCTIPPNLLPYACTTYRKGKQNAQIPKWNVLTEKSVESNEQNCMKSKAIDYIPSTNVAPTTYTPVMLLVPSNLQRYNTPLTNEQEDIDKSGAVVMLQPMMWGLIPPWHRSDSPKGHGLTTNNARIENIKESKLYKHSLENKQRCVVICDGFYEWKTFKDKTKQPYIIYKKQNCLKCKQGSDYIEESTHTCVLKIQTSENLSKNWTEDSGWIGQTPLFMAGIYSKWSPIHSVHDAKLSNPVYSYSVITRESGDIMKWIHHRMPLFLSKSDDVDLWLDPKISSYDAIDIINKRQNDEELSWHPVSPNVGAIKNQGNELIRKVELSANGKAINKSTTKSANIMMKWLKPNEKSEDIGKKSFSKVGGNINLEVNANSEDVNPPNKRSKSDIP